jgi:arginase family enzyme
MEYSEIFIPPGAHLQSYSSGGSSELVGNNIKFGVKGFDWEWLKDFKVALVGLRMGGSPNSFTALRESFYSLYMPQKSVSIIDLGDIEMESGATVSNGERVEYVLNKLLSVGIFPVVFAENMNSSIFLYGALKQSRKETNVSFILPHANMGDSKQPLSSANILAYMLADYGRELSALSLLGCQSYLTSSKDLLELQKYYCEVLRLGAIRDNERMAEPLLRDANLLCFSANAVRQSDASAANNPSPNGFYAEEACRLFRFAGFSEELKACYLGGFNCLNDIHKQTSNLLAQLIWHAIEGVANRVGEHPLLDLKSCRRLQVDLGTQDQQLVFYQGKITDRWWMEVPVGDSENKHLIACLKEDYEKASHFEIPDRWLWFLKKYALS